MARVSSVRTLTRPLAAVAGLALLVTAGCSSGTPKLDVTPAASSTTATSSSMTPTPVPTVPTSPSSTSPKPRPKSTTHAVKTTPKPSPTPTRTKKKKQHHSSSAPVAAAPPPVHVNSSGIYAIGDSVMVDAQPSLRNLIDGIHIDAAVSRQAGAGMPLARGLSPTPKALVWGLGTNGTFPAYMLHNLIGIQGGNDLIVVTSHCPHCGWTDSNNAMIHSNCAAAHQCYVADFQALAQQHPGWFVGDGVHMPIGGAGAKAYARVVAAALCAAGDC
jgi:hypothetical protein